MKPQPGDLVKVELTREGVWTEGGIEVDGRIVAVPPEAEVTVVKPKVEPLYAGQMWRRKDDGSLFSAARYDSWDIDKIDIYNVSDPDDRIYRDEFEPDDFELLFDPRWGRIDQRQLGIVHGNVVAYHAVVVE